MQSGKPSRTAMAAATHRALHQTLENGSIFSDPLAITILGGVTEERLHEAQQSASRRAMRIFIATRTRFAEDALAAAVERGVSQLVILGAGLDTYSYRGPLRERLQIFEVDHPATQAWKRDRLAEIGISLPPYLAFAPVDFERETLPDGLRSAGFNPAKSTFLTWLGVVPYLTQEAVWSTLSFIASFPQGAEVVFDYGDPPETLSPEMRTAHDLRAARVSRLGERFLTYFEAEPLRAKLAEVGFHNVEDLGPPEMSARYFPGRAGTPPSRGGHVVRASTL